MCGSTLWSSCRSYLHTGSIVVEGYSQINNQNKGLGAYTTELCQTALRSTVVDMLHLAMSARLTVSRSYFSHCQEGHLSNHKFVEGDVNSFALAKGAVLVGTSQRMKSFHFTFDQQPGASRRLIQEKGSTMAAYWAVKGTGCQRQYALAHKSGLGRVVLIHTTDEAFLGPG